VVDSGVRGFAGIAGRHASSARLVEWKDPKIAVRVLKMNRKRGNVVVSRRAILDEQVQAQRQVLLDSMAEDNRARPW